MSNKQSSSALTAATLAALGALAALSCNMNVGGATTTSTDTGQNPATAAAAKPAPAKPNLRSGDIESTGLPPSAEVVTKTRALATRLSAAIGQNVDAHVAFVNCNQEPCSARLSASTLESLQQAISDVQHAGSAEVMAEAREHLDPYQGRSFEADLEVAPDAAP
ncbi:MAG TPA: hypothetical protein VNG33_16110 [Polyangiaceae bacterium]|nr:hypothetical protein [Polyangiaceae bacterium]